VVGRVRSVGLARCRRAAPRQLPFILSAASPECHSACLESYGEEIRPLADTRGLGHSLAKRAPPTRCFVHFISDYAVVVVAFFKAEVDIERILHHARLGSESVGEARGGSAG